jgi:hypothetical protein
MKSTQSQLNVNIYADRREYRVTVPEGSSIKQAVNAAGIELNRLDRLEPPPFTELNNSANIRVIRVTEKFEVNQEIIPFERQIIHNETLPVENEIMLQGGKNGIKEITFRRMYEDGIEVSKQPIPVKSNILKTPVPEIIMVGMQASYSPINMPGRILYIHDGNVWMMEESTNNRKPIIATGDLDGHIFSLSSDGAWLIFSRLSEEENVINHLWATDIESFLDNSKEETLPVTDLINLGVSNVIHFADWVPGTNNEIVFSTVEPQTSAPGWQANNDLYRLKFNPSGWTSDWNEIIKPNTGGIYGWWGTDFLWHPDGKHLTFSRPDLIGMISPINKMPTTLAEIIPFQTEADWAWIPGITWSPEGGILYIVNHVPSGGSISPETSTSFSITAITEENELPIQLASMAGMFAYPLSSPTQPLALNKNSHQIAFLQAIYPDQSDISRYRVTTIDQDGSNRQIIFPPEGSPGLKPQKNWGAWSPNPMPETGNPALAIVYLGNLWFLDTETGETNQITGDGLISRLIWK